MDTCRRDANSQRRRGVTISDLLIAVLVMGILAAVAIPRVVQSIHSSRVNAAAERVKIDLAQARRRAVARSATLTVSFSPAADTYTISGVKHLNGSSATYTVQTSQNPYQTDIVSAVFGGDSSIQFDRFGQPDSAGTVVLRSGDAQRSVLIDAATGRASSP